MRIPRIFSSTPVTAQQTVKLDSRCSHYLLHVLRIKKGQRLCLFDGRGSDFSATVCEIDRKTVVVDIGDTLVSVPESPLNTTLAIGISKGERMDWVIQKSTELGINCIQPLFTERVEVKLSGERLNKKLAHWQSVAVSACEQCGRSLLPEINVPAGLDQWLARPASGLQLLCTAEGPSLNGIDDNPTDVTLLIGPEGGFSAAEEKSAIASQYQPISLGQRILRTETAPVAALALLQSRWGDY